MELSQGQIIQKPNKQELSSLFMTHRLNVMHAPTKCTCIKFHKYIPYGLGVMARTQFMAHRLNVMHAPEKFHKYIPYDLGLGVMAQTRIGTDGRTGRTRADNSKTKQVRVVFFVHDTLS